MLTLPLFDNGSIVDVGDGAEFMLITHGGTEEEADNGLVVVLTHSEKSLKPADKRF